MSIPVFSDAEMKVVGNSIVRFFQKMSMKFTKNQYIRRLYPFVDIWISGKSWLEVCIRILSA